MAIDRRHLGRRYGPYASATLRGTCVGVPLDAGVDGEVSPSRCGDGVRDPAELCDGHDLGGRTCEWLGYYGGTLACLPACDGFDHGGCAGFWRRTGRCPTSCW